MRKGIGLTVMECGSGDGHAVVSGMMMVCGCGEAVKPVSTVMMAVVLMMMAADDDDTDRVMSRWL